MQENIELNNFISIKVNNLAVSNNENLKLTLMKVKMIGKVQSLT